MVAHSWICFREIISQKSFCSTVCTLYFVSLTLCSTAEATEKRAYANLFKRKERRNRREGLGFLLSLLYRCTTQLHLCSKSWHNMSRNQFLQTAQSGIEAG
uniref:Putative secreted protein n=1 Tax=Ixodes ricinus TaxID=34613 RepID=A0A6B0UBZ5_IXORI